MRQRFTIDGSPELEQRLEELSEQLRQAVANAIPESKLEALVLGGGYGRGEGGVLRTQRGDEPYNDFESYVFVRGSRLINQRRYGPKLHQIERELSRAVGLQVELKIDSLGCFAERDVSMFSYDLVSAHRVLFGGADVFSGCGRHRCASNIPLSEATRLLFNRCSGLLLVRELLTEQTLDAEDADFIGRNIAKAQLALGDAVLTVAGQYHWSVRERERRLRRLPSALGIPARELVLDYHRAGAQFKLHPQRIHQSTSDFSEKHRAVSRLASELWLWIEARRLAHPFKTVQQYALDERNKCPETPSFKNCLLNLQQFGPRGLMHQANRYPRERLFNSFPLLLWNGEVSREPAIRKHLQRQLQSTASDWRGLVSAYKEIWPSYG
jgi:hypothetical protein